MSLILRLNVIVAIIFATVLIIGSINTFYDIRTRLQQEITSSSELTNHMVDAQLNLLQIQSANSSSSGQKLALLFHLQQFKDIGYLNIRLYDTKGILIDSNTTASKPARPPLPDWLINFLTKFPGSADTISEAVNIDGKYLGYIVISPDVDSELGELWFETKSILMPLVLLSFLAVILLFFLSSWIVKPAIELIRSVNQDDASKRRQRSSMLRLHELPRIGRQLTGISNELQHSSEKVQDLSYRIIHLQEDERRKLSAELHDELGQHLTAICFEAAAIKTAQNLEQAKQSAVAIDSVGRDMRDIVRSMLERLRPPELDMMGLRATIAEMVGDWQLRHLQHSLDFSCTADFSTLDDTEQLSIYRIVQECLTNISRHAGSEPIHVAINLTSTETQLSMCIKDDGCGCDLNKQVRGFGLKGMRERVEGFSGQITLDSSLGNGMTVSVSKPI